MPAGTYAVLAACALLATCAFGARYEVQSYESAAARLARATNGPDRVTTTLTEATFHE